MGLYDAICFGCKKVIWDIVQGYDVRTPFVDASEAIISIEGFGNGPTTGHIARVN